MARDTTGWIGVEMVPSKALKISLSCLFQMANVGLTVSFSSTVRVGVGMIVDPSRYPARS